MIASSSIVKLRVVNEHFLEVIQLGLAYIEDMVDYNPIDHFSTTPSSQGTFIIVELQCSIASHLFIQQVIHVDIKISILFIEVYFIKQRVINGRLFEHET